MHVRFLFFFLSLLLFAPLYSAFYKVQTNLNINWKSYLLTVNSSVFATNQVSTSEKNMLRLRIKEDILSNVSKHLENLSIDSSHSLADLLEKNSYFAKEYSAFLENIESGSLFFRENYFESKMTVALRGEASLLHYVPAPWQKLHYQVLQEIDTLDNSYQITKPKSEFLFSNVAAYTGLVIDAREFDLKKAILPRIYSQDGRLIYGPEYLSRTIGVQRGLMGYVTSYSDKEVVHRAGMKHYFTVPMSIKGKYQTDIVLSHFDSAKILSHPETVTNLRKARVIILTR